MLLQQVRQLPQQLPSRTRAHRTPWALVKRSPRRMYGLVHIHVVRLRHRADHLARGRVVNRKRLAAGRTHKRPIDQHPVVRAGKRSSMGTQARIHSRVTRVGSRRSSESSHIDCPFLRLCPVASALTTSAQQGFHAPNDTTASPPLSTTHQPHLSLVENPIPSRTNPLKPAFPVNLQPSRHHHGHPERNLSAPSTQAIKGSASAS